MTDTEQNKRKAICEAAGVTDIDDVSDGFHTFRQLYYQRMMLFAAIVRQNKGRAWKSLRHEDGELCFGGGWFIVGIDTPEGCYTYHYETEYFDTFDCEVLERGKHWDGHTEKDVTRLLSLPDRKTARWLSMETGEPTKFSPMNRACPAESCYCSECKSWLVASDEFYAIGRYCPNCGAKMEESE